MSADPAGPAATPGPARVGIWDGEDAADRCPQTDTDGCCSCILWRGHDGACHLV